MFSDSRSPEELQIDVLFVDGTSNFIEQCIISWSNTLGTHMFKTWISDHRVATNHSLEFSKTLLMKVF